MPVIRLSNNHKVSNVILGNSLEFIEVFIIQLNSHFGKPIEEWVKIAANVYIEFNLKRTNQNPSTITDRIYLSALISNQIQPVFTLSRSYPKQSINYGSNVSFYDTIEVMVGELNPLHEDYQVTIVYHKHP